MNSISQFEDFIENFMEGSLTRMFRSDLQPVEIAKRLGKAMESDQRISVGKVLVPNFYSIHLSPKDFESFQNYRISLEREFASHLTRMAKERRFAFATRPSVKFIADESMKARRVLIVAAFADDLLHQDESEERVALAGLTTRLSPRLERPKSNSTASLVRMNADGSSKEFAVSKLPFNIGRSLDNDLILEELGVSRYHAQIRDVFEKLCIIDMKSTNGTKVNGESITQIVLNDGDKLTLAGAALVFRIRTTL